MENTLAKKEDAKSGQKQMTCIWGAWWIPFRPFAYTLWLAYEVSYRIMDHCVVIHMRFVRHHAGIAQYTGDFLAHALDIGTVVLTFLVCHAALTLPACFIMYKFLAEVNLTNTRFEEILKKTL